MYHIFSEISIFFKQNFRFYRMYHIFSEISIFLKQNFNYLTSLQNFIKFLSEVAYNYQTKMSVKIANMSSHTIGKRRTSGVLLSILILPEMLVYNFKDNTDIPASAMPLPPPVCDFFPVNT